MLLPQTRTDPIKTDPEIQRLRNYKVVIANTIINDMECNLSRHYLLLLRYMISQIKPDDMPDKVYSIDLKEFMQVCNINEKNGGNYTRIIKRAYQEIQSKVKWIQSETEGEYAVQWFSDFCIDKRTVSFSFHKRITPYLFDLVHYRNGYTHYRFEDALAIPSNHGILLYEFIKQYYNLKKTHVRIGVSELRCIMGAGNYKMFNDFRRFILERALTEINTYSYIKVEYTPVKAQGSRAYTTIEFRISKPNKEEEEFREVRRVQMLKQEADIWPF